MKNEWSSKIVEQEAKDAGLTIKDFPDSKRTGTKLKKSMESGCFKKILKGDVKKILTEKNLNQVVKLKDFEIRGIKMVCVYYN